MIIITEAYPTRTISLVGAEDILRERGVEVVNLGEDADAPANSASMLLGHRSPRVQKINGKIH
jgi:hypothetical protein